MLQLQVIQTDVLDRPLLVRRHSFPASPSDSPLNRVAPLPDPLEEDTAERSNSNSRTDGVVDSLQPNMGEKDVIRYQELSEMELTEAEKKLRWLNAGRRRGRTKFFNAQKGFGFIIDEESNMLDFEEVFVHYSSISKMEFGSHAFKSLREGELVEYSLTMSDKGYQAVEITGVNLAPCLGVLPKAGPSILPRLNKAPKHHRRESSSAQTATTTERIEWKSDPVAADSANTPPVLEPRDSGFESRSTNRNDHRDSKHSTPTMPTSTQLPPYAYTTQPSPVFYSSYHHSPVPYPTEPNSYPVYIPPPPPFSSPHVPFNHNLIPPLSSLSHIDHFNIKDEPNDTINFHRHFKDNNNSSMYHQHYDTPPVSTNNAPLFHSNYYDTPALFHPASSVHPHQFFHNPSPPFDQQQWAFGSHTPYQSQQQGLQLTLCDDEVLDRLHEQ